MFAKYGKSKNVDTLARLAWTGALAEMPGEWEPAAFAAAYKAAFRPTTSYPWGYRGLATSPGWRRR